MEAILLSVHATLAAAIKTPELELSEDEAKRLAQAIAAVQAEYPATRLDPKIAVLVQFAGVAGVIYGSRLVAIRIRRTQERAAGAAVDITPSPQPTPREPTPAAQGQPEPIFDFGTFGTEGKPPDKPINFPV